MWDFQDRLEQIIIVVQMHLIHWGLNDNRGTYLLFFGWLSFVCLETGFGAVFGSGDSYLSSLSSVKLV